MKRIKVRPGKFVLVSAEVLERVAQAAEAVKFTREEVERMAALEPRGATVYAGPVRHPMNTTPRTRSIRRTESKPWLHQRVATKIRRMLDEDGVSATSFDIDAWVERWLANPLPQLKGRSPTEAMAIEEDWPAIEAVLENLRGGLPG
jgi:hypothetical protein